MASPHWKIPGEFINEVLTRVDLVDLIASRVPLKKVGAQYMGRCPFHAEKTPSFSVSPSKQLYHCFGCGAGGNAIGFLMAYGHLSFVEAVEDLAGQAGLAMPEPPGWTGAPKADELAPLYDVLQQAADHYVGQLRGTDEGKKAVAYLKKRGISSAIAKEFMVGYAPGQWHGLAVRFDGQALLLAGLVAANPAGQTYDRFRDRIMFPIRNRRGRVVGFGGRVLDDSQPKYLNSPESPLFHKGREVYGLFELLQKDAKPRRILMVEGYMDVLALAQAGIGYAVAALGTAVSEAHIQLLYRFTAELVFCFDGDRAGREAAWRALEAVLPCLQEGRGARFMTLPDNHDPDSLLRAEGAAGFVGRLDEARPLSEYFFERWLGGAGLAELEGRARLIAEARPYLEKIPAGVYKQMMVAKLYGLAAIAPPAAAANARVAQAGRGGGRAASRPPPLQRQVLAMLVQQPALAAIVEAKAFVGDDLVFKGADAFKAILGTILSSRPATTALLLELYRDLPDEPVVRQLAAMDLQLEAGLERQFADALDRLVAYNDTLKLERLWLKLRDEGGLAAAEMEAFRRLSADKLKPLQKT